MVERSNTKDWDGLLCCYLCNTLYLKGSWWGLRSLLSSRQLGMVGCLMRHQMLPRAVHFVLVSVPQIPFPDGILVPGSPFLSAVSRCKMSVGSKWLWMCYRPPETLRWETVLIAEHLHDCAHSSEAFWSWGLFINRDQSCSRRHLELQENSNIPVMPCLL